MSTSPELTRCLFPGLHLDSVACHTHTHTHTQSLRQIQLTDLTTHLDIFEDHRENDFEEMLHRFQDIRVEFKYPFRDIPLCYNVSFGGVPSPRKSNQIAGFKFLERGVYMCVGGGELCVCVCV